MAEGVLSDWIYEEDTDYFRLLGKCKKPLRLYTQDDKPVTDRNGYLIKNIVGKTLANIDLGINYFCDTKGLNLIDALGRKSTDSKFDPTTIPSYEKNDDDPSADYECHTVVYDINGYPLTDKNGRPLLSRTGKMYLIFGPRGDIISDISGRDVIDKIGKVLTRYKPVKDKDDNPSYLFDFEGKPLTDSEGFPLLDITGSKMVLFEDNTPCGTPTGSDLHDAEGISKKNSCCDFAKRPPLINKMHKVTTDNGDPAVAFDLNGYPLTDLLGNPLCFNSGNCMIINQTDKWVDHNGDDVFIIPRKVYDRFTLRGFTNLLGDPIRLFDDYGRPLTDLNGLPQRHGSGKLLIKFDQNGAPISDWLDRPLYDVNGLTNKNSYFRPCIPFSKPNLVDAILKGCPKAVQYFECTGMPLTNPLGYPLVNAREELMIVFDAHGEPLHDYQKKIVFNALGLPMIRNLEIPLLGPGNVPIRLYDKDGRPLTDSKGLALKDVRGCYLLKAYSNGLEAMDSKRREVYDKEGNSTKSLLKFNASGGADRSDMQAVVISVDGEPMLLYDVEGFPLTDLSGTILHNRMGELMIKCPEQGFTTTLDDKPVYDVKGRKCLKTLSKNIGLSIGLYDKNSRPLTDRYGSVLHSRKGSELILFDKNSWPISALVGGDLFDYKGVPLTHPFADPSFLPKNPIKQMPDGVQLFDYEDLPLTDASGNILFTSSGIPMVSFDVHGRVKCDHSGRPVFDISGLAVSRTTGAWKDQNGKPYRLFSSNYMPLTDENGRELYDINGKSLIRQDNIGRPKYTTDNTMVRDFKGRAFTETKFKPTQIPFNIKKTFTLLEEDKLPLRIYNKEGKPLTDSLGRPLVTCKGELLINIKNGINCITDLHGRTVFDRFRMPLGCSAKSKIKSMDDSPMMLFDDKGTSLTDQHGVPLKKKKDKAIMIIFDQYGRPSATENGTKIFDHAGRCSQHPQFGLIDEEDNKLEEIDSKITLMLSDNEDLISVYDVDGRPII